MSAAFFTSKFLSIDGALKFPVGFDSFRYHDVAITFLLVVGEQLGFHIVERLSSKQLRDFMAPTMEKTTFLLHFMYPIVSLRTYSFKLK